MPIADNAAAKADSRPPWLELALAEYEALRAEVLTTMETQVATLRFGMAALSLLVIGAFSIWEDMLVTTLAFLFAVPFVSKLALTIWIGEVTRMMRAGDHLKEVEDTFHDSFPALPKPVMQWETNLRNPTAGRTRWKRHYEWNYLAIVLMFWSIAAASMALGVYRGASGGIPADAALVCMLGLLLFLASLIGLLLILRQLATVSDTQGILRFLRRDEPRGATATPATVHA